MITHLKQPDREQLQAIVDLHCAAFPEFFLTSLGPRFLRLLYRGFATMPGGICILAEDAGRVIGFAAGTTEPDMFFKRLLRKHGLSFALAAVPGLLRNPFFVARKCLGAVFYRGEQPAGLESAALLSSLAVDPECSGKGVGQALVKAFVDEAAKRGCKCVYLTTDQAENERVNRFYEKCGFRLRDSFPRPGQRIMNRWVWEGGTQTVDRRLQTADLWDLDESRC